MQTWKLGLPPKRRSPTLARPCSHFRQQATKTIFIASWAKSSQHGDMYISLEGCIGAGKTTVARGLAQVRRARLVEEDFELNPFLAAFYKNPTQYVLETEFVFLLIHFHQLNNAPFGQDETLVSDFMFDKDLIYADLNFCGDVEKAIFHSLHNLLMSKLRGPDLVIFLSSSDDLILKRIKERRRGYELEIDAGYYTRLNAAYESFFQQYSRTPVLTVDAGGCDFVKNPSLFPSLSGAADRLLREGRVRSSFPA